jgi:hypothetical protein
MRIRGAQNEQPKADEQPNGDLSIQKPHWSRCLGH